MTIAQLESQTFNASAAGPAPSLDRFMSTLTAYQSTSMLQAAIELDLFTIIGDGDNTVEKISGRIQGSERGVRMLCDCLVIAGFLTKSENRYGLTIDTHTFLDRNSRAYSGDASRFMASDLLIESFRNLASVVRSGRPIADTPFAEIEHPAWVEFARSMSTLMFLPAQQCAKLLATSSRTKILDVAAGHGIFGISIAQSNPQAEIVALDWPSVLTVANENAVKFGVRDRYTLLPGDALEIEFGSGYDVVLVPNLLHHWGRETIGHFLKKVRDSLVPGGRIAIIEFVPNDDRVSPPLAARFALNMLAMTKEGDAYTEAEYRAMLTEATFSHCESYPLLPTPMTAIVASRS
jgi:ubiquinone/menaquinone biosynthesis C-methylase UbiE